MDNHGDDSETTAKVSDSAYSNSCSNSQSRKSHSSKSTHSGSNSSGSSGYGGKQSTSVNSKTLSKIPEKRTKDKEGKKKKQAKTEVVETQASEEFRLPEPAPVTETTEEPHNAVSSPVSTQQLLEGGPRTKEPTQEDIEQDPGLSSTPQQMQLTTVNSIKSEGFSCVISMLDGVVLYMSSSLTSTLGFPKDMWIGRSFIDFVHPLDHNTFASQITSGLTVPKKGNGMQNEVDSSVNTSVSTMFCRIRRHRGLEVGFNVKEKFITFKPFMLRLSFKNNYDDKGLVIYLVIQATPLMSAFNVPYERVASAAPFTMRHVANGNLEYMDNEAVQYLGFMPQDVIGHDALNLYHPEDLIYLRHVYEAIVKQGQVPRTRPYRLMTQNGYYLKLETEWTSFINPWSRKLEFVIGKHHVVEGPENPDVFQEPPAPTSRGMWKTDDVEVAALKESIVMILNEVPTKPAEAAKQIMTKRCQDLASFMESLIEEQPKPEEELRLEIQDHDNSYFERDSVMLGGISPHHDYNDSKSSASTPLSYNQLNFNINLKRYFDSHHDDDEKVQFSGANTMLLKTSPPHEECLLPIPHRSGDSMDMNSMDSISLSFGEDDCQMLSHEYHPVRLTESLLSRHNSQMERIFVKKHRDARPINKEKREKINNANKQKKKDHLTRCNASFVPAAVDSPPIECQEGGASHSHGVKRTSKQLELESEAVAHKQHCPSSRQARRRPPPPPPHSLAPAMPSVTVATVSTSASMWAPNFVNGMNPFMPQQMAMMPHCSVAPAMPGFVPMYYVPAQGHAIHCTSEMGVSDPNKSNPQQPFPAPPVQYMMYGQAVFGSPIMVSPVNHQVSMHQNVSENQYVNTQKNLRLPSSNYEEACKPGLPLKAPGKSQVAAWREEKRAAAAAAVTAAAAASCPKMLAHAPAGSICSATNALNRSTEAVPGTSVSQDSKTRTDEVVDRTDGESSYSSFYSSFFKTESGSADDSGGAKKTQGSSDRSFPPHSASKDSVRSRQRRRVDPPWMEHVSVTSELIYKYQIMTKNLDEVLLSDKNKLEGLEQPSLVNEQLGQLYADMQLEGGAARLTLEEGITSSGSSGEENSKIPALDSLNKRARRKRKYSKLVMIYEEDAPLPSPDEDAEAEAEAAPATSAA